MFHVLFWKCLQANLNILYTFIKIFNSLNLSFIIFNCKPTLGRKYEVHMESGLNDEKGLEILSLFVDMKIKDMPAQADKIVRECKGMVFTIFYYFRNICIL